MLFLKLDWEKENYGLYTNFLFDRVLNDISYIKLPISTVFFVFMWIYGRYLSFSPNVKDCRF